MAQMSESDIPGIFDRRAARKPSASRASRGP